MFIIFGWGRQTVKEHGPVEVYHCQRCNNDRPWILYSRKTWFTLFFIPVIPYSFERFLICPICNSGVVLDTEKFNELKAIADKNMQMGENFINGAPNAGRLGETADLQNVDDTSQEIGYSGKTETQINYLKQIKEFQEEKETAGSAEEQI